VTTALSVTTTDHLIEAVILVANEVACGIEILSERMCVGAINTFKTLAMGP